MQLDVGRTFEAMVEGLRGSGLADADIARGAHVGRTSIWRWGAGEARGATAESYLKLSSLYEQRLGAPPTIRTRR